MLKRLRLHVVLCLLVTAMVLMGCPDAGIDDPSDLNDPDPVDPASLPALPDSADQVFLLVRHGTSGPVSLFKSGAGSPGAVELVLDDSVSETAQHVRLSPGTGKIAYINTSFELRVLDAESGLDHLIHSYSPSPPDIDEFWWHDDDTLLFSPGGDIERAFFSGPDVAIDPIMGSEFCYHDLSQNGTGSPVQTAMTYIDGNHVKIQLADYENATPSFSAPATLTEYRDAFSVDFDPRLTWVTSDILVWRLSAGVSELEFCNVPEYLADPETQFTGTLSISGASSATSFLLTPDGSQVVFFGGGVNVCAIGTPLTEGLCTATEFYTEDIEYNISNFTFSPTGEFFLVGSTTRIRCYSTTDLTRYRWWEDTDFETQLDSGELRIIEIIWE